MSQKIVRCVRERTVETGKGHLPLFRVTLLTSLWKSGERAHFGRC